MQEPLKAKVILGIVAHADDLDFCASGTIAKLAAEGSEVYYLILTDGSKGSEDHDMTPEKLINLRQEEQRKALKVLGGKDVYFLNYPDGELEVTMQLKREIVKVIRSVRPDLVITMDPSMVYSAEQGYINHPDHRAAGQAALDAVFPLARDHLTFPELYDEGYQPHKTMTVLLINFDNSNYYVDISNTYSKKIAALKAHDSQMPNIEEVEERVKEMAVKAGEKAGCELAEGFIRIDIR